jgi:cell division protein FtsZ
MPNAKRASMREGPLAALFRKTAEDTGAPGTEPASGTEPAAQPEEPTAPPGPEPPA